jgi:hypothetical protein
MEDANATIVLVARAKGLPDDAVLEADRQRGLRGTADVTQEVANELLMAAMAYLQSVNRVLGPPKTVARAIVPDAETSDPLDDVSGGLSSVSKFNPRKPNGE